MDPVLFFMLVAGLCAGSFLNMLIARLPDPDRTLFRPLRSACPQCDEEIGARDNIPVFSYLALRGRCRSCRMPIGRTYVVVEILSGIAVAYAYYRWGASWEFVAASTFLLILIATAVTDLQTFLIPDVYTLGGALAGVALAAVRPEVPGALPVVLDAVAIGGGLFLFGWCLGKLLGKEALGFGDVLLVGMMATYLGFGATVIAIYLASVSGVVLYVLHRGRTAENLIPFGLHLAVGGALSLLLGGTPYAAAINAILPWH